MFFVFFHVTSSFWLVMYYCLVALSLSLSHTLIALWIYVFGFIRYGNMEVVIEWSKTSLLQVMLERESEREMIEIFVDYWELGDPRSPLLSCKIHWSDNRKKSCQKLVALWKTAVACFLFLKTAKSSSCGNFVSIPILLLCPTSPSLSSLRCGSLSWVRHCCNEKGKMHCL